VTSEEQLWAIVDEAGLDSARLRGTVASGRPQALLDRDLAEADRLGVRGMPTTFIDDRRVEGTTSLDRLRRIVGEEARAPRGRR
jgi:predicted DsbA family dithiol-disulfide isomerase